MTSTTSTESGPALPTGPMITDADEAAAWVHAGMLAISLRDCPVARGVLEAVTDGFVARNQWGGWSYADDEHRAVPFEQDDDDAVSDLTAIGLLDGSMRVTAVGADVVLMLRESGRL